MIKQISSLFGGETYQARAFRGTALVGIRMAGQNILRLGSNLILTRILFPEAFGLMALVTVVLSGAAMFSDLGINNSILQHKRGHDPVFLNTAWTVQIGRGIFLCLMILLLAEPIAAFYNAPQLGELLMVSAFLPFIQGFYSTRIATARREIQLGRLVVLEIGAQALAITAMILLSLWLQSVWGLVLGTLVAPTTIALLSHFVLKGEHPNRLSFDREALSSLFGFGKWIFLATLAGFVMHQGDRAVLGRYVSLGDLAVYNIGFFLASVPRLLSNAVTSQVVYPLYARRPPAESENNRRKINRARMLMTAGLVLILAVMAVLGDWLVRLLYDARYHGGGPILVVIAVATLPQIIIQSYLMMPLAFGHSGRFAAYTIFRAVLLLGLLVWTVPIYGVWAAAIAPGLSAILIYPFLVWAILPYKGWDPRHDILFAVVSLAILALVIWLHGEMLADVVSVRQPAAL